MKIVCEAKWDVCGEGSGWSSTPWGVGGAVQVYVWGSSPYLAPSQLIHAVVDLLDVDCAASLGSPHLTACLCSLA